MPNPLFESFLHSATMFEAEQQLLGMGSEAVPILQSLFSGESKNAFGVPYRNLGLPLRCALELALRLGPTARALEPFLRAELERGNETAVRALGALGTLEPASVFALIRQLERYPDTVAWESARALKRCGQVEHPAVLEALNRSQKARTAWAAVGSL